jgi:C1A family cysteine protease
MKIAIVLISLIVLSTASFLDHAEHIVEFAKFVEKHGKSYSSVKETMERFSTFVENHEMILKHNSEGHSWKLGINEFADMTWEEFSSTRLGLIQRDSLKDNSRTINLNGLVTTPDSVDWSTKNAVTDVKNQGQCGSCWAFSTTGSTEGAIAIKTGQLTSLSEQQLVDCSAKEGNLACRGGLMDSGFQFIIDNNGICAEADYPYKARKQVCQTSCSPVATISSFKDVAEEDEDALLAAVATQPVSVAIEADKLGFQFYQSGVFSGRCGTNLDHGVLAVGYGTLDGKDYWKVKNSWGASWGQKGYILLARGSGSGKGQCGIAMQPSYPIA